MKTIFLDKQFKSSVAMPSAVWVVLCAIYITVTVGWGNLSAFLVYELAVLIIGAILPIALLAMFFSISRSAANSNALAEQLANQSVLVEALTGKVSQISDTVDANKRSISDSKDALERTVHTVEQATTGQATAINGVLAKIESMDMSESVRGLSTKLDEQGGGIKDLKGQVEDMLRQANDSTNTLDLGEIHQRTALLGFINVILNDMNVASTRILVRLMEAEGRQKNEIKDFIQGLVNAYSVGDRGVFFTVLQHQLSNNMERLVSLQDLVKQSPDAQRDLSKIMGEMNEISGLFQSVGDDDIAKTVCDSHVLETLNKLLGSYFNADGSPKDTPVY